LFTSDIFIHILGSICYIMTFGSSTIINCHLSTIWALISELKTRLPLQDSYPYSFDILSSNSRPRSAHGYHAHNLLDKMVSHWLKLCTDFTLKHRCRPKFTENVFTVNMVS